ncbi:MAG: hypothetical protein EHM20_00270 [Alphaproteobacteria bacterium]|nr:MAG: hypothetical protein EHM20_00270 [Alphaproteobacteria bacterium]
MDNYLSFILNKNHDNKFFTGIVYDLDPLQVLIYPADDPINCKATSGLLGLSVGSNVIMMKIGNQFIITNIIGNPFNDNIILNRNSTQTVTTTDQTKIEFNSQKILIGSRLSYDSTNKGVKIGKGVNYVDVNTDLWIERTVGSYSSIHIYKNSTQLTYAIAPAKLTGQEGWFIQHSQSKVAVVENDLIYVYVRFSVSHGSENVIGGGYTDSCNLLVKAIG